MCVARVYVYFWAVQSHRGSSSNERWSAQFHSIYIKIFFLWRIKYDSNYYTKRQQNVFVNVCNLLALVVHTIFELKEKYIRVLWHFDKLFFLFGSLNMDVNIYLLFSHTKRISPHIDWRRTLTNNMLMALRSVFGSNAHVQCSLYTYTPYTNVHWLFNLPESLAAIITAPTASLHYANSHHSGTRCLLIPRQYSTL